LPSPLPFPGAGEASRPKRRNPSRAKPSLDSNAEAAASGEPDPSASAADPTQAGGEEGHYELTSRSPAKREEHKREDAKDPLYMNHESIDAQAVEASISATLAAMATAGSPLHQEPNYVNRIMLDVPGSPQLQSLFGIRPDIPDRPSLSLSGNGRPMEDSLDAIYLQPLPHAAVGTNNGMPSPHTPRRPPAASASEGEDGDGYESITEPRQWQRQRGPEVAEPELPRPRFAGPRDESMLSATRVAQGNVPARNASPLLPQPPPHLPPPQLLKNPRPAAGTSLRDLSGGGLEATEGLGDLPGMSSRASSSTVFPGLDGSGVRTRLLTAQDSLESLPSERLPRDSTGADSLLGDVAQSLLLDPVQRESLLGELRKNLTRLAPHRLDHTAISLREQLGNGKFGTVYRGELVTPQGKRAAVLDPPCGSSPPPQARPVDRILLGCGIGVLSRHPVCCGQGAQPGWGQRLAACRARGGSGDYVGEHERA
jgi:hypothetical protein